MTRTLLRTISLSVALLSVAVATAGWVVLGGLGSLGAAGPGETFSTLHRTLDLSVETTATVREAMTDLDGLVAAVADSSGTTAEFVDDAADITTGRIAASLGAVERAMPALIEAGAVIDDTLRTLSLFGVDYRPEVPFDEALEDVRASLDGLAGDVAAQGATLRTLVPAITRIETTSESLAGRIADTERSLVEAETLLADYRSILAGTERSVETVTGTVGLVAVGRVLSIVIGVAGVVLAVALWRASRPIEV